MNVINNFFNVLNEMINKKKFSMIENAELSNELLETLKLIENCIGCKDNIEKYFDRFRKSTNEIECWSEKEIDEQKNKYIRWIPFDKFRNVEYLAKGWFGEVHKATWINGYYDHYNKKYEDRKVVLKRIYNSNDDKIVDILNEVKWKFIIDIYINAITNKFKG